MPVSTRRRNVQAPKEVVTKKPTTKKPTTKKK